MEEKEILVIHPEDPSTSFLKDLYYNRDYTKSNKRSDIKQSNLNIIMMLGHGTEYGLLNSSLDGYIIDSRQVQFLRNKICIGIWCNANIFAEKYNLHGLFSGMIISEPQEAFDLGISVSEEEVRRENKCLGSLLRYCLDRYELKDIPENIIKLSNPSTEITKFNYNNFYYY